MPVFALLPTIINSRVSLESAEYIPMHIYHSLKTIFLVSNNSFYCNYYSIKALIQLFVSIHGPEFNSSWKSIQSNLSSSCEWGSLCWFRREKSTDRNGLHSLLTEECWGNLAQPPSLQWKSDYCNKNCVKHNCTSSRPLITCSLCSILHQDDKSIRPHISLVWALSEYSEVTEMQLCARIYYNFHGYIMQLYYATTFSSSSLTNRDDHPHSLPCHCIYGHFQRRRPTHNQRHCI